MKSIYYIQNTNRQNKYIDIIRMLFLESVPTFKILKLFSFISLYIICNSSCIELIYI